MRVALLLLLMTASLIISGCVQQGDQTTQSVSEQAKQKCIETCMMINWDLTNRSPCLSDNNTAWNISDWVCDVAHSPRQPVDNLPENQCSAFREGKARHFVEVGPDCKIIRAV